MSASEFDYFREDGEGVMEWMLEAEYRDMLDEVYETVNICGYTYDAGYALKQLDPIAYRCGYVDWLDSELQDERLYESDPTEDMS